MSERSNLKGKLTLSQSYGIIFTEKVPPPLPENETEETQEEHRKALQLIYEDVPPSEWKNEEIREKNDSYIQFSLRRFEVISNYFICDKALAVCIEAISIFSGVFHVLYRCKCT
jgi:hypothetical protein